MHLNKQVIVACVAVLGAFGAHAWAADRVFSGPQAGEKVTPFTAVDVVGPSAGKEREAAAASDRGPAALVFVHGIERSIAPLLTVLDEYGHVRRDRLRTEIVFLSADRVASEKQLPLVARSLRLQCPLLLSVDGPEGPGSYGLNKACLMTIVVAKENRVTANFALVQPGIADAPAAIRAMAEASGDAHPPTAEALRERRALAGGGGGGGNRRGAATQMGGGQPQTRPATQPKGDLPGAAPTDARLVALLRSFIQRANDDAAVDRVVAEVEQYVNGDPGLTRQAVDGWTRVLHLKYGTEYAQKAGRAMLERLTKK